MNIFLFSTLQKLSNNVCFIKNHFISDFFYKQTLFLQKFGCKRLSTVYRFLWKVKSQLPFTQYGRNCLNYQQKLQMQIQGCLECQTIGKSMTIQKYVFGHLIHPMLSKINNYQRKQKKTRKTFYYSINIIIQIYIYRTRTLRFVSRYTRSSDVTDQQNQNVYFLIYFLVYFLIYFLVYLEEGEKFKFEI